jgi:hypothetical protein
MSAGSKWDQFGISSTLANELRRMEDGLTKAKPANSLHSI